MVKLGVASPLLHGCRRWYLPVVFAIVDNPIPLVEPPLLLIDIHQVVYALLSGYTVNCEEVLE